MELPSSSTPDPPAPGGPPKCSYFDRIPPRVQQALWQNKIAPAEITLPAGIPQDIHLKIDLPVDTSIPISIPVHVDIPLNQTDLHEPFVDLQGVVSPYKALLSNSPNS